MPQCACGKVYATNCAKYLKLNKLTAAHISWQLAVCRLLFFCCCRCWYCFAKPHATCGAACKYMQRSSALWNRHCKSLACLWRNNNKTKYNNNNHCSVKSKHRLPRQLRLINDVNTSICSCHLALDCSSALLPSPCACWQACNFQLTAHALAHRLHH